MTLADRIVIMKDGHIQQVGTPNEVYRNPANTFVARFIGAPSMNLLDGVSLPAGLVPQAQGNVLIGVRPDDLHPVDDAPLVEGRVTCARTAGAGYADLCRYAHGRGGRQGRCPHPADVGATVRLGAASRDLHVFDAATGAAMRAA